MAGEFAEYLVGMGVDLERLGVEFGLEKHNFARCCRTDGRLTWPIVKRVVNWAPDEHKDVLLELGIKALAVNANVEFKPFKIADQNARKAILKSLLEY